MRPVYQWHGMLSSHQACIASKTEQNMMLKLIFSQDAYCLGLQASPLHGARLLCSMATWRTTHKANLAIDRHAAERQHII